MEKITREKYALWLRSPSDPAAQQVDAGGIKGRSIVFGRHPGNEATVFYGTDQEAPRRIPRNNSRAAFASCEDPIEAVEPKLRFRLFRPVTGDAVAFKNSTDGAVGGGLLPSTGTKQAAEKQEKEEAHGINLQ